MLNKIVFNKASVTINNKKILKDISFAVEQKEPVCLIGMGSSGKSTVIKSVLGLVDLSSGDIKVNDVSIFEKRYEKIIDSFGVVFQKDALFDSLTVWQNIMFKSLGKQKQNDLVEQATLLLAKVGLNKNDAFLFPAELSGGMKKRVAIARAVSHSPKYLLLDDPTAGLDPVKTNVIFKIIKEVSRELKTTVLAISSDMKGVIKYFNQIVVLKDSNLHWKGKVSDAKKNPTVHIKDLLKRA